MNNYKEFENHSWLSYNIANKGWHVYQKNTICIYIKSKAFVVL